MTDIEQKALALLGEVSPYKCEKVDHAHHAYLCAALRLSVERHEAFRQEVSDVVTSLCNTVLVGRDHSRMRDMLSHRFIIPAKPDPLVRIINEVIYAQPHGDIDEDRMAGDFRSALDALGFEIREKGK